MTSVGEQVVGAVMGALFSLFKIDFDFAIDESDILPQLARPSALSALPSSQGPLDLDHVASLIQSVPDESVIVLVGAGASVSAGIPDFRTPGTGLYDNLQAFNLPYPEAIFDIGFFRHTPEPFYKLCKEMWPGQYEPTPAHRFLQKLYEHRKLKRCYTQNIDSLEAAAGLPKELVVAAHGNFDEAHVVGTGARVDVAELKRAIFEGDVSLRALCQREGGLVKPAITFFGEELPARFGECVRTDFAHCRLLLIFGTSLQVR